MAKWETKKYSKYIKKMESLGFKNGVMLGLT